MSKKKLKPMVRLTKEQIEQKKLYIAEYKKSTNAATGSAVDSNSNVGTKTISTLMHELWKDANIQVNRSLLYDKIEELYSKELAEDYISLLESHVLYKNDETSLSPYCVAINMYPFLEHGMTKLGGESKAPKHLESYCGSFINLVFAVSSQFSGAVATVEFLLYFHYFAQKDFGKDYLNTHKNLVISKLQHVVFSLNQPAAARGYQSVFWNVSVFDKFFYESMFGNFMFPDFTKVDYEQFNELQKFFLEFLLNERTESLLTFPVLTEASLNLDEKPKDEEWARFIADVRSRGLSMFSYNDDNAAALSSCCFRGDEVIKVYEKDTNRMIGISIKDFVELLSKSESPIDSHIDSGYYIKSLNPSTLEIENANINGILKKKNTEKMVTIEVATNPDEFPRKITVTADHIFLAKDKFSGNIVEITAEHLIKDFNQYQLPVTS